jgi:hypothetical protein
MFKLEGDPVMTEINAERIAREVGADESLVSEVVSRLTLVRGTLSDAGFTALIRDVVKTKVSFAERDAREDLSVVRMSQRAD